MARSSTRKVSKKASLTASKRQRGWRTAATSDRHDLYERSVQEPSAECDLIDQIWKEQRGRRAELIREDFCGTAAVCMEWVKRRPSHRSWGVDLDPQVLAWGTARMPERLTPAQRKRVTLLQQDVRTVRTPLVDTVLAMNFSYFIFKERAMLKKYFKHVHRSLKTDGLFLLDAYGGHDSFAEMKEEKDFDGFTYVWDQNKYNPITGDVVNYIHFKFPDRTRLNRAFTYEWRLWTLPEIQEILLEAGFRKALVYWEGTDEKTGEGDNNWAESRQGEACPGWVAYLVGVK